MKTAMQELMEWFYNKPTSEGYEIMAMCEILLNVEKEQMFEFADRYVDDVMGGCVLRANEYFEKHYNQNK